MRRKDNIDDTIIAVSTPIGEGGIGIVRLSGPAAIEIADRLFLPKDGRKIAKCQSHTIHYGHVVDRPKTKDRSPKAGRPIKKGGIIDEVLLTVMRAPRSYTREDVVEINCHGGIQAVKKVLDLSMRYGARIAEPGEFTKRAFLNGRLDLAQAEAVLDTIRAKTEGSLKVAVSQLGGRLSGEVNAIRDSVVDMTAEIEASIDFPEEGLQVKEESALIKKTQGVIDRLKHIIDTYGDGMVLREGVLAIICGKPNVGKSSLMNLLLKRDRVIVSPIPGTTRDTVEEVISLKGVPIRLVDTAGITKARDIVEREGILRSRRYLELADIALIVLDASTGIGEEDADIIGSVGDKKKIVILNKCDLPGKINEKRLKGMFKDAGIVRMSVTEKRGIENLERTILDTVWGGKFTQGEGAVVSNARHKELLDKAYGSMLSVKRALKKKAEAELIAIDLKEAIFDLGLIVGRSVSDDVLDRIFEQFCIGK